MSSLNGKVSLITGGAQGLGKAFGKILLQNGARVCVADVNESIGKQTVASFSETFGKENVAFVKCDVTSQEDMANAFDFTKKTFQGLDLVINNAGICHEGMWEKVIQINLIGIVRGTMLAIDHMSREKGGQGGIIVNIASIQSLRNEHYCPAYNAAKHGVLAFTRSWAKNPDCEKMGLQFHTLCPGSAATGIASHANTEDMFYDLPGALKKLNDMGKMSPETVAEAFLKLVQCEGSTGEVLLVTHEEGTTWVKEVPQI